MLGPVIYCLIFVFTFINFYKDPCLLSIRHFSHTSRKGFYFIEIHQLRITKNR